MIAVPSWSFNPFNATHYLYFAHHLGDGIRLAFSTDGPLGPFEMLGNVFYYTQCKRCLQCKTCTLHVASPDVHVLKEEKSFRMYFHSRLGPNEQVSFVAVSRDGINWEAIDTEPLTTAYLRVFFWEGFWYGVARAKSTNFLFRSIDGITPFEKGPILIPPESRHVGLLLHHSRLYIFFSRSGDCPESLLVTWMNLKLLTQQNIPWTKWMITSPTFTVAIPRKYQGEECPLEASKDGISLTPTNQLRDPAPFVGDDGTIFLIYSIYGEFGLAIDRIIMEDEQSTIENFNKSDFEARFHFRMKEKRPPERRPTSERLPTPTDPRTEKTRTEKTRTEKTRTEKPRTENHHQFWFQRGNVQKQNHHQFKFIKE